MARKGYPEVNSESVLIDGEVPFWRSLRLDEMTPGQWESLCDGCARCCLNKLEDEETGDIEWTCVSCRLLDSRTCRCTDYPNRSTRVPDCIQLDPDTVARISWLPVTCAYRLVHEGHDLYWWHPLVSGDPETVHAAGISVRGRTISENNVAVDALEDYIVAWPNQDPGRDG